MEFLINNWYIIVALGAVAIAIIFAVIYFFKLPSATQIANIKEWLKFAVTEAEKALGSGTGQLKLRMVYDMAAQKFPWITFISFDTFSKWVDEALEWLNKQLEANPAVQIIVKGDASGEIEKVDLDDGK